MQFLINSGNFVLPCFCLHIMEPSLNNKLKSFKKLKVNYIWQKVLVKKIYERKGKVKEIYICICIYIFGFLVFFHLRCFLWLFWDVYFVASTFNSSLKKFMTLKVWYTCWKVLEKARFMLGKKVKIIFYRIYFFCNLRVLVLLISDAQMFENPLPVCVR